MKLSDMQGVVKKLEKKKNVLKNDPHVGGEQDWWWHIAMFGH
jgi:hypothetical protein